MTTPITKVLSVAALLAFAGNAHALSLSLSPTDLTVEPGVEFALNVDADFIDDPTLGGGFDISWDSAALTLMTWSGILTNDEGFNNDGAMSDGYIDGAAFGAFNGVSDGLIGTLTFVATGSLAEALTTVMIGGDAMGGNNFAGPFVSADTFAEQDVMFNSANVDVVAAAVPVPAALWLMIAGLGSLLGFRRNA